ncbi:MAG: hypothetical protein CMJ85_03010 [Planctomycetes bacterium]|nr:hypothetical protein [Planctomycetota bacterium]MDP6424563.1 hypothetical protein [Planctomycetota bacterium]
MIDLFTRGNKTPGWNASWSKILDKHISVALQTKDTEKTFDAAFAGIDWNRLENAWKDHVKRAA